MNLFAAGRRLALLCFVIVSGGLGCIELGTKWSRATEPTPTYNPRAVYMHGGYSEEWEIHETAYRSLDEIDRDPYSSNPKDRYWAPGSLGEAGYAAKVAAMRAGLVQEATAQTFSFLKWTIIAAALLYAVVSGIGWVVRGAMGIPMGQDHKPAPVPNAPAPAPAPASAVSPDLYARVQARAEELRGQGLDATEAGVQAALDVLDGK